MAGWNAAAGRKARRSSPGSSTSTSAPPDRISNRAPFVLAIDTAARWAGLLAFAATAAAALSGMPGVVVASFAVLGGVGLSAAEIRARTPQARLELEAELRYRAFHDALTGLANRALFHERVTHAMRGRRPRAGGEPAVVFLDLDDFKEVNDTLGHSAGDSVLRAVADRIETNLRAGDTAARLGGDEFAVFVDSLPDQAALDALVDRVLTAIGAPIMVDHHHVVTVTASAGVARATAELDTPEALLHHADIAMYRAKRAGKGNPDDVDYETVVDLPSERIMAVEAVPTAGPDGVSGDEALVDPAAPEREAG